MKKIGKIITIIIILAMFFCNISSAANLGEKNAGGTVVAIYQNKEYVAIGVTREVLIQGQVLAWNKWSEEDLITLYNKCSSGTVRYANQEDYLTMAPEDVPRDSWFIAFSAELNKRDQDGKITRVGTNDKYSLFQDDGTPTYQEGQIEFKKTSDMTEDDTKRADEYKQEQDKQREKYKDWTVYKKANYLLDKGAPPDGLADEWERELRIEINRGKKDSAANKKLIKAYEKAFGAYETSDGDVAIYTNPEKSDSKTSAGSLDDMISDADSFAKQGELQYEDGALKNLSTILYNCFLAVGVAIALVVGIVIGIKYMMGSIEEKATYKQMLVPYLVGCLVVFGAFGIWKLVVVILESM